MGEDSRGERTRIPHVYDARAFARVALLRPTSLAARYGRARCCSSSTEPGLLRGRHGLLRAKQVDLAGGRHGVVPHPVEVGGARLARQAYDHALPELVREGGNVGALAARAQGAPKRVVGLTWIDEGQAIVVAPGSGITAPQHLEGKRLALPRFRRADLAQNRRGASTARAMSLAAYKGALGSVGLTLDDVELVEVGTAGARGPDGVRDESFLARWEGLGRLSRGEVDAVYVKGPGASRTAAKLAGAEVGIDLDRSPERRLRVNDGTPRPITVHEDFSRRTTAPAGSRPSGRPAVVRRR
jgi:hypothetical protein